MINIVVAEAPDRTFRYIGRGVPTKENTFCWTIVSGSLAGVQGESRYNTCRGAANALARYLRPHSDLNTQKIKFFVPIKRFNTEEEINTWVCQINEEGLPESEAEKIHKDMLRRTRKRRKRRKRLQALKGE